jgi:hypothetical protein
MAAATLAADASADFVAAVDAAAVFTSVMPAVAVIQAVVVICNAPDVIRRHQDDGKSGSL